MCLRSTDPRLFGAAEGDTGGVAYLSRLLLSQLSSYRRLEMMQEMAPENVSILILDVFGMAASLETGALPWVLVTGVETI